MVHALDPRPLKTMPRPKNYSQGSSQTRPAETFESPDKLLRDREALVRGDALMSLRQTGPAIKAYKSAIKHAQTKRVALEVPVLW